MFPLLYSITFDIRIFYKNVLGIIRSGPISPGTPISLIIRISDITTRSGVTAPKNTI